MGNPLVSVMLPTYNQVDFVHEAIVSAAEQDYANLEVVVSDDGSTDGTLDVILECAQKYPDRVLALAKGPHLGITGNCNRNLRACRGKYIAFSAGDDVLLQGKISCQVGWLEADKRRVLCGHNVELFDSDTGETIRIRGALGPHREGEGASSFVRYGVVLPASSVMVQSSSIPAYGYDERLPIVSDWKFFIDCLASGGHFGCVDGVYGRYRRHDRNTTSDQELFQARTADQFSTLALVEAFYPHLVSDCRFARARLFLWVAGGWLLRNDPRKARIYLINALKQYPWRSWKVPLGLLLTYLPQNMQRAALAKFTKNVF
jgi:glycosyltransferase involved in cell wall biosynthesis